MIDILGAEHPLHHELVGAPEIKSQQGHPGDQPYPGHTRIADRPDQAEHVWIDHLGHRFPTAHLQEGRHRDDNRPDHQQHGLDGVSVDHRRQPTGDGVDPGDDCQHGDGLPNGNLREDQLHQQSAGIKAPGGVNHNIEEQGQHRKIIACPAVETFFQKFRHGINARPENERQKKYGKKHQDKSGHPLVIEYGNTGTVGISGQADQGGAGDIGGKERDADKRPDHRTAGQEVIFRGIVLFAEV